MILASAIMPLAKVTLQREREAELHRVLREMRTAIDKYKDAVDTGQIGSTDIRAGSEGYPPDLETLVEGVVEGQRRIRDQAQVPAADADGSDDALDRVGHALVPGQAGLEQLGRPERLRRLLQGGRHRARRHEIQGLVRAAALVHMDNEDGQKSDRCLERGREGARQARSQRGFTLIELLVVLSLICDSGRDGDGAAPQLSAEGEEATLKTDLFHMRDAIDQYFADKGKYPSIARRARERQLPAEDSRGSDHPFGRHVADDPGGARPEQSDRRAGHLQRSERRRWDGARRNEVFGLEMTGQNSEFRSQNSESQSRGSAVRG